MDVLRGARIIRSALEFYGPVRNRPQDFEVDDDRCEGGVLVLTADAAFVSGEDYLNVRAAMDAWDAGRNVFREAQRADG